MPLGLQKSTKSACRNRKGIREGGIPKVGSVISYLRRQR